MKTISNTLPNTDSNIAISDIDNILTEPNTTPWPSVSINAHTSRNEMTTSILLATAVIQLFNHNNEFIKCRVFLDSGLQNKFMTKEICSTLKLRRTKISCSIIGIGQSLQKSSCAISAVIKFLTSDYKLSLEFRILPKLTNNVP